MSHLVLFIPILVLRTQSRPMYTPLRYCNKHIIGIFVIITILPSTSQPRFTLTPLLTHSYWTPSFTTLCNHSSSTKDGKLMTISIMPSVVFIMPRDVIHHNTRGTKHVIFTTILMVSNSIIHTPIKSSYYS